MTVLPHHNALETFTPRMLRDALGAWPTGVAIITTLDAAGRPVGLTVNSFSSVSLEPPLVLWSLSRRSGSFAPFSAATHWAVHILCADQQALSARFATPAQDRFAGLDWHAGLHGSPLLDGCAARLDCRAAAAHEGGDHVIFVGEVLGIEREPRQPLAYHAGRYVGVKALGGEALAA